MDSEETPQSRSRVFTVRIWSEAVEEGSEQRGKVRDVASGAYRNFREWSDLTEFLSAQIDGEAAVSQEGPMTRRDGTDGV